MSNPSKDTLLIIDSFALIFRAYYAYPPSLTLADGQPINAVYGFTSLMLDVLQKFKPSHVIAVFDPGGPVIRQTEFTDYKANRKETDKELLTQIPMVQEVLESFEIPVLKVDGYEADDVIATIDKRHSGKWARTIIVTGDQDLFQLVDEDTFIYLAGRKFSESKLFDTVGVIEKWGIRPEQVPDFKALFGDASDNIPGVKGIGKKSAEALLKDCKTVEEVYEKLEQHSPKLQKLLSESYEIAMQSKKLATVEPDVPLSFDFTQATFSTFSTKRITEHFEKMRFRSLIKKVDTLAKEYAVEENVGLFEAAPDASSTPATKQSYEKFDLNVLKDTEVCFINPVIENVPLSPIHWDVEYLELKVKNEKYKIVTEDFKSFIEAVIKNEVLLVGFDIKKILHAAKNNGINISKLQIYDVGFAGFLVAQGRASFKLENLADFFSVPIALLELDTVEKLYEICEEKLQEDAAMKDLLGLELSILPLITDMETEGMLIDTEFLSVYEQQLTEKQQELVKGIYADVGHEFNIGSPKQVSEVLFKEKNLGGIQKTKTGAYSTNERILRKLVDADPVVGKILKYREIDKLLSTYIKALPVYKEEDGKVHSVFDQFGAVSGRFASKNPNMQNIPINREIDINVRNAFVAGKGNILVAFDYSQQELRILAAIAGEKDMIDSFNHDKDIHKMTAAEMFDTTIEAVTDKQRAMGKLVNFSVVYGVSPFGLSEQLEITQEEARTFIKKYYDRYTSVKAYFEEQKEFARKNGYVETLFGRKRSSATINSQNRFAREAAERELLNFRIQGSAADIMKLSMKGIAKVLPKYKAHLLLQIHDEFVFEIEEKEDLEQFQKDIKEIMEDVHNIGVKYKVNSAVAERWGELK